MSGASIGIAALLAASLRLWTPLALAALGGVVSERAGVVNIGLEGMMLGGAFASVAATAATGNMALGLLAGIAGGALVGFLHALFVLSLRVPPILSGVGLNLGMLGLTTFLLRTYGEAGLNAPRQLTGESMVALAVLLVGVVWVVLYQTPVGLRLRACGESARAAQAAGLSVFRIRLFAVTLSGALAGLGGVALVLTGLGTFTENVTAGRGYIALAAVIFGRWNPLLAACAALLFGLGDALQLTLQTAGLSQKIPPDFLALLPYVVTLLSLAVTSSRSVVPQALNENPGDE